MSQTSPLFSLPPDHWTPILEYLYDVHVYRLVLTTPKLAHRIRLGLKTLHLAFSDLDAEKLEFWPSLTHLVSHSSMKDWNDLSQLPNTLKSFRGGYISGKLAPQTLPAGLQHLAVVAPFVSWTVIASLPQTLVSLKLYECHSFNDEMGAMLPRNLQIFHLLCREPSCACGSPEKHSSTSAVSDMLFRSLPQTLVDLRVETACALSELALILCPPNVATLQLAPLHLNATSYRYFPASVTNLILNDVSGHVSVPSHLKQSQKVVLKFPSNRPTKDLTFADLSAALTPHLLHLSIGNTSHWDCDGDWTLFPALQVLKVPHFNPQFISLLPRQLRVFHCYKNKATTSSHFVLADLPRTLVDLIFTHDIDASHIEDLPPAIIRCALGHPTSTFLSKRPSFGDNVGESEFTSESAFATVKHEPTNKLDACKPPLFEILRRGEPVRFIGASLESATLSRYLNLSVRQLITRLEFEKCQKHEVELSDTAPTSQAERDRQIELRLRNHTGSVVDFCRLCHFNSHLSFSKEALHLTEFEREHMESLSVARTMLCGASIAPLSPPETSALSSRLMADSTAETSSSSEEYFPDLTQQQWKMDLDEHNASKTPRNITAQELALPLEFPLHIKSLAILGFGGPLTQDVCETLPNTIVSLKITEWQGDENLSSLSSLRHLCLYNVYAPLHSLSSSIVCLALMNCGGGLLVLEIIEALQNFEALPNLSRLSLTLKDSQSYGSTYGSETEPAKPEVQEWIRKNRQIVASAPRGTKILQHIVDHLADLKLLAKFGIDLPSPIDEKPKSKKHKKPPIDQIEVATQVFHNYTRFACYCILRLLKHPNLTYMAIGNDWADSSELFTAPELLELASPHMTPSLQFVSLCLQHFVPNVQPEDAMQGQIPTSSDSTATPFGSNLKWRKINGSSSKSKKRRAMNELSPDDVKVEQAEEAKSKSSNGKWRAPYRSHAFEKSRLDYKAKIAPPCDAPSHQRDLQLDDYSLMELFTTPHEAASLAPDSSSSMILSSTVDLTRLPPPLTALRLYQNTTLTSSAFAPPSGESLSRILEFGAQPLNLISQLQTLVIHQSEAFTDETISFLPRSLTELTLGGKLLSDDCVQHLPPHLASLVFTKTNLLTDASIALLPRSLASLSLPSSTLLTDHCVPMLPPALEKLNLQSNSKFTDLALASLPRSLTSLYLTFWNPSEGKVTDSGMSDLPPSLTELWMNSNSRVTSACFGGLPRSLLILSASAVSRVRPEHLPHLPPHLHRLHLNAAVGLTETDILLLPTTIARLRVPQSASQAVLTHFPLLKYDAAFAPRVFAH